MKKKCVKEALQIKNQHPRVISLFHIPPLDNIIHKKSHNMPCGQKKIVQTTNKLPRVSTIKMTKIKLTSQQQSCGCLSRNQVAQCHVVLMQRSRAQLACDRCKFFFLFLKITSHFNIFFFIFVMFYTHFLFNNNYYHYFLLMYFIIISIII